MLRLLRFGLVSALGLAVDVLLFILLTHAGLAPGFANLVSAGVAVSLVFAISQHRVFRYSGGFLLPLFLAYLLYQVVAVTMASAGVAALAQAGMSPLAAKAVVIPVTFGCNYAFMTQLLRRSPAVSGSPAGADADTDGRSRSRVML